LPSSTSSSPSPPAGSAAAATKDRSSPTPAPIGPGGQSPIPGPTSGTASSPGGSGFPTGAYAGIGIAAIVAVALVSLAAYKLYGMLPEDSLLSALRVSRLMSDSGGSPPDSSPDSPPEYDESRFAQKWVDPDELPPTAVALGEAVAASVGGEFAGIMRPGTEKVRPPQVITRTAQPEMLTALSDLPDGNSSSIMTPISSIEELGSIDNLNRALNGTLIGGMMVPAAVSSTVRRPRVDLIVVVDASGALSWQEYRLTKEAMTRPGGLLDSLRNMSAEGSRVAFVEYAYDSVVVSELDDDFDRVKRRVLSAFQGDANNWDRDAMYIYEVDEKFGGNALRKVNSLKTMESQSSSNRKDRRSSTAQDELDNQDEAMSMANAAEVPPAMNGLSRELHLALKWSRLEMLPPLANRQLEIKMEKANRLRRVLVVNGGELTNGGSLERGFELAKAQADEMEARGIALISIGIGAQQDAGLERLATGDPAAYFSVHAVEDVDAILPDVTHMILSPRFRPSSSKLLQAPAPLFKQRLRSRFHKSEAAKHRNAKLKLSDRGVKSDIAKPVTSRATWRDCLWGAEMEADGNSNVPAPNSSNIQPVPASKGGGIVRSESNLPPWFRDVA
jgi:hypothetical protein